MPTAFPKRDFEHVLADARYLATRLLEHEHQLCLVQQAITAAGPAADQRAAIGQLCDSARANRYAAGMMLTRMLGDRIEAAPSTGPLVLIVDDSDDIRLMIAAALEASGFRTVLAANGLEGVLVAHYARPSVILMDVTMPILDGIEAARLLKSSALTRHLNVIAHTAHRESHRDRFATLFADVLPKPSNPDTVVATVRRFASA